MIYDHSLYRGRNIFCRYCLHAFITEEIVIKIDCHIKDCFKINEKGTIKIPKKGEYVKFRIFEIKIKPAFVIYAHFESILVPEDNKKQSPNESYTNKYQKYVACSYVYLLACDDDKFSKTFKSYLGKDVVYNFISSMTKERKCCGDMMKKFLTKNL